VRERTQNRHETRFSLDSRGINRRLGESDAAAQLRSSFHRREISLPRRDQTFLPIKVANCRSARSLVVQRVVRAFCRSLPPHVAGASVRGHSRGRERANSIRAAFRIARSAPGKKPLSDFGHSTRALVFPAAVSCSSLSIPIAPRFSLHQHTFSVSAIALIRDSREVKTTNSPAIFAPRLFSVRGFT